MFCGNCGAQVPDGSSVCPNCGVAMAPKAQAPSMNQSAQYQNPQFQNPQGNIPNQGAPVKGPKKINGKIIGIVVAVIAVIAVLCLVIKLIAGGGGPKGTYASQDGSLVTFKDGHMIIQESGMEMTFEYKFKKDEVIVDPESMELSDNFWEVMADELGIDEDDLEDTLEEYAEYSEEMEALYKAYKDEDMDALVEMLLEEMDVDEDEFTFEYDKKNNVLKNSSTKDKMYYAEDYKKGPSGKYTSKEDDDITITFKNGTATYDDDGDDEKFEYYVYAIKNDVYVIFAGEDFTTSDFYKDHNVSKFEYNSKKDKFSIGEDEFKK